jgi:N-acetylmuramoyl-L-alanine amidase
LPFDLQLITIMTNMDKLPVRRVPRPSQRSKSVNIILPTLGFAILLATLFTSLSPSSFSFISLSDKLAVLLTPQAPNNQVNPAAPALRIGIVSGHRGNDSGAVCTDANGNVTLTEADVNFKIATLVVQKLTQLGYQVDLLNEFDNRLNGYRAVAIVSIHNDSCQYINDQATGFKVAAAVNTRDLNRTNRLLACLIDRYHAATGLPFHANSITPDMTSYHAFNEIDPNTVAAIIETGFLNLDQEILTQHTDQVADGVVNGILCFVNNENIEPTPTSSP